MRIERPAVHFPIYICLQKMEKDLEWERVQGRKNEVRSSVFILYLVLFRRECYIWASFTFLETGGGRRYCSMGATMLCFLPDGVCEMNKAAFKRGVSEWLL